MVAPLIIAAAGMSAVGKLFGGFSANKAAKRRAKRLEESAGQALAEGGIEAQMGLEDDERAIAAAMVAAAANGGGLANSRGVLDDLQRQSVYRSRATIYRATAEAKNFLNDATESRKAGRDALIGGVLGAGGSLLSGFASAGGR